jgi:hypothetical protein
MSPHFIPQADAPALDWMLNFAGWLMDDPWRFGIAPSVGVSIAQAVDRFGEALWVATQPATRTTVTTQAKRDARKSAERICRQQARIIKYNDGILHADKIAIGVRPQNPKRTPINVPLSSPMLKIVGAASRSHSLRFNDSNTPTSRAKPFGAIQLQVFVALADAPVRDPEMAHYFGGASRNGFEVEYEHEADGKVATYFGRWVSRRGDVGPWSSPVSMRVAA